jgi:hypothetical protein
MMPKLVPFAAALGLAAAPLAAQAAPQSACFRLSDIQSTKMQPDDRALYLRASTGAYYKLEFGAACPNPGDAPLVLHPTDNSDMVCSAIGLDVRVRGAEGCIPTSLTRLTPDEVSALPANQRP